MPKKLHILPLIALLTLMLCSCRKQHVPMSANIDRLDLLIADTTAILSAPENRAIDAWLEINGPGHTLEGYRNSRAFETFSLEIKKRLPSLDSVEQVLGGALANIGCEETELYGLVIPNTQSVVTHPSGVAFIGLNHYLGAGCRIYTGFPNYIRRRKTIERLPVDVVQALLAGANPMKEDGNTTVLNALLYNGALLEATRRALPEETSEAMVLGMTEEDYAWCEKFEEKMWKTLIDRGLLYSTSQTDIRRLTEPAPSTSVINANAPGQAALYLGMKIAQSYLANNKDAAAGDLLKPEYYNSNQSLVNSNYNPHGNR